ncbi:MAG: hypothetical protein K1W19_05350, partial [Lachnospiraceae bacterium]
DILKLQNNKKKGDDDMKRANSIKLTDDSLTNIKLMLPLLNGRAKERFVDMMYGYFISEMYSRGQDKQSYKFPEQLT